MVPAPSNIPETSIDRFWTTADRGHNTDQTGWLLDPSQNFWLPGNNDIVATHELSEHRCLILLGQPGMGKSSTLSKGSPLVLGTGEADSLTVNLAAYSSEERLERVVLDGEKIRAWMAGSHELCLTLDSFDEAHTRIETLPSLLAEYLAQWDCSRLKIRIACRTSEWPLSLEEHLEDSFGKVARYELLPLRRRDAADLVRSYGIEEEPFLEVIEAAKAVPLASRPLTLKLLANAFEKAGDLPRNASELYRQGLGALCDELNPKRRDAGTKDLYQSVQRYETACRLAAISLFSGRLNFWLGPRAQAEDEDLTIEACSVSASGKTPYPPGTIKSALQTGIFSGSGSQHLTWSHATFADFLAAQWLTSNALSRDQLVSLLCSGSGKLYLQVRQVAAWLVATSNDYSWLIDVDPEAFLLNVDVPSDMLRQRILASLFALARSGKLQHSYLRNYAGLAHPRMSEQLGDALRQDSTELKRIVIAVAQDCGVQETLPALASIALDKTAELSLRVPAAWAVYYIGRDKPGNYLVPLLDPPPVLDEGNKDLRELLDPALLASWPHAIATRDVLELLESHHRSGSLPTDSIAVTELSQSLTADDLQTVCQWLTANPHLVGNDRFAPLAQSILELCLANLDLAEALATATLITKSRAREHEPIFGQFRAATFELRDRERRMLAVSALADEDSDLAYAIAAHIPPDGLALLREDDFDWLMAQYTESEAGRKENLGYALQLVANPANRSHVDKILGLPGEHPAATLFQSWRGPTDLTSKEAKRARRVHERKLEIAARKAQRQKNKASAEAKIRTDIEEYSERAKDGDAESFWQMILKLMVPPDNAHFQQQHQPDLTSHPRWQTLSPERRQIIEDAARLYLRNGKCEPEKWVENDNYHPPATAGYCALVLLLKTRPQLLKDFPPDRWREWAPIIVGWHLFADSDAANDKKALMELAMPHARAEMTTVLLQLIDGALASNSHFFLGRELELLMTDGLAEVILENLDTQSAPTVPLMDIVDALMTSAREKTVVILSKWVNSDQRRAAPERAREAALRLLLTLDKTTWPIVSELMMEASDFLRSAVLAMQPLLGRRAPDLDDAKLSELYEWLAKNFAEDESAERNRVGTLGPAEAAAMWRDAVLDALVRRGTSSSVAAVEHLADKHPKNPGLKRALARAEEALLELSWEPLTIEQIDRLGADPDSRLIRSEADLFTACTEALSQIQDRLQGDTPTLEYLWDSYSNRPKFEDAASDYIRNEMQSILLGRGGIVNREVQIRPSKKGFGERTDIRVDAVAMSDSSNSPQLTLVGEVKGCWNKDIEESIQTQLVERYMADLHASFGIYIAVWFDPASWDPTDYRRKLAERFESAEGLRASLERRAKDLERPGRHIEIVVLDASRSRPKKAEMS